VEVLDRQHLQLARIDPGAALRGAAFGAVAVAAGVVADLAIVAVVAFVDVCAECAGAAGLDGVQRATLLEARVVLGAIVVTVQAHDVGDLELRFRVLDWEFPADLGGEAVTDHAVSIVSDVVCVTR